MNWTSRRRFWESASVHPEAGGFTVSLDSRPLRTPGGAALLVPTESLARAVAGEWDALDDEIRPERLPLTRAANSAIDRVAAQREAVIDSIAAYADTDLVCYRAASPDALVARQAAAWDPWLAWSAGSLGARLVAVTGVMPYPQPAAALAALRARVAGRDTFALVGLHELVSLSGSLVLGLAVADGALAPEAAWELSRIDETWQAEQWGLDSEAEAAATKRRADFLQAHHLLTLLGHAPQ